MGIRSQNNPIAAYLDVFSRSGTDGALNDAPNAVQASGGSINDYTVGSDVYRTHVFTSSGTFEVTSLSTDSSLPSGIEYLVVAGGGGGVNLLNLAEVVAVDLEQILLVTNSPATKLK